jgi:HK97 family phage portal protein
VTGMTLLTGRAEADAAHLAVAERCRALISQTLASLPLKIVRRLDRGGSEEATTHPLWRVLNDESSDGVSAYELRELLVRDVCTVGNAFAEIVRDGRGIASALIYLPARNVGIEVLPSGRIRYRVTGRDGQQRTLLSDELVHLRYASRDGITGIDPLTWAKTSSALAGVQADLARSMAERSFTPDLAFEFANNSSFPSDEQGHTAFERLKAQLTARVRGMARSPLSLLLEGGLTAKAIGQSGREAQFHESRTVGLEDIARAFGVPMSVVGLDRQTSYGSLTEESKALVRDCLRPWAARIEQQLAVRLLSRESRQTYRLEFDMTDMLRGNMPERFGAYKTAIESGFLSVNNVRDWEGLSRIEGGDVYANTVPAKETT